MPFSSTKTLKQDEWEDVFQELFKPTFEFLGYKCLRSEVKAGSILQDIIANLHTASVVFADLTDNKPNVSYELGMAHAITSRVILATQHIDECLSDLKPYGIIQYDPQRSHERTIRFQADVKDVLSKLDNREIHTSPVFQYLGKTIHHLEDFVNNPVAVMQCLKCNRFYYVELNETTQSDFAVDAVERGKRIHPVGIEHVARGLCGHWECARFKGIRGIHYK
jgi:hypothetical protein